MKKAVIVLGHGSKRLEANLELGVIVDLLQKRNPELVVERAYVEFAEPTLEQSVAQLMLQPVVDEIIVVPLFLTVGNHLYKNIPERLAALAQNYPQVQFKETKHLGADPLIVKIIENRIETAETSRH